MKKISFSFAMAILLCSSYAVAVTKVDPMFNYVRELRASPSMSALSTKVAGVKVSDGRTMVGCIIRSSDIDKTAAAVAAMGGRIGTTLSTVITADVPLDMIEQIAALEEVAYIELSKPVRQKMDFAKTLAYVDTVQAGGGGLSAAYTGSGVVVGVVDSGVDCTHADFSGRISAYWDMDANKKYTASEIASGSCYGALSSSSYHGTHVAGIAAGANSTYKGNAPAAGIVAVQTPSSTSETDVINGVAYVFQKAQENHRPAVANLSLGTSLGAHDGTSAFETGINETVAGKYGRAVVCAAGNETVNPNDSVPGYTLGGLHGDISVTAGDIGYESIVRDASGSMIMDVWLDQGSNCSVELAAYDSNRTQLATTGSVALGGTGSGSKSNIRLSVDFTDSNNANNHKQQALATVTYLSGTYVATTLTYDLIIRNAGSGCHGDVWLSPDYVSSNVFTTNRDGTAGPTGDYTYSKGDNDAMTTIPSTASSCIAVASYSARDTWTGNAGQQSQNVYNTSIGATGSSATDLSLYSSHGPGIGANYTEVRQKPDIAAPGEPIISTLSGNCGTSCQSSLGGSAVVATDNIHFKLQGTSMSAPYVTGVVALLLERNGCLTASEIKTAITGNAISDQYTGSLPNYNWGYGKVNALATVGSVAASSCQPDNPADNVPTDSSSGCSLRRR